MSPRENQKGEGMKQDLSNARIIEWEEGGEGFVGARTSRRNGFQTVSAEPGGSANYAGFLTELEAENVGVRVVAEFPRPSLAEIVGGAPAFLFTHKVDGDSTRSGMPHICFQRADGNWMVGDLQLTDDPRYPRPLVHTLDVVSNRISDFATVVPLVPREGVS